MISRRNFLLGATTGITLISSPFAAARLILPQERKLALYNLHTGEKLNTTYWVDGHYAGEELAAINHLMRDHRTDLIEKIDKRLLDQLFILQHTVGSTGTFHIISGYRSPKSNARLRRDGTGVAKRSLHMQGRAVDVRLPGVRLKHLRQAALNLHAGGVGYYPKSNFIHLDTGRTRFW